MRALLAGLLVTTACSIGAPPGWSDGDSWSFPLISPLEHGPLLAPVEIDGRGPYPFLIDPDSPVSQIDAALVTEIGARTEYGPEYIDERDQSRPTLLVEVRRITIGTLTVRARTLWVAGDGAFHVGGHQVRGVIGADLLTDSMAWGFDRRRGVGYLATQQGFTPAAGATRIGFRRQRPMIDGMPTPSRRLTTATIDGHEVTVHLDLGAPSSQLREGKLADLGLAPVAIARKLVDERGTTREVDHGAVAAAVGLGGLTLRDVTFVPYDDRRWSEVDLDGTLGLDAFAGLTVWVNLDDDEVFFVPDGDGDATAERIARWGSAAVSGCATPACATIELLTPAAANARPVLMVSRDVATAPYAYELLLEARTADGAPLDLPRLIAILPADQAKVSQLLDERYGNVTIAVVDVSPFPRTCPREGGCVYLAAD